MLARKSLMFRARWKLLTLGRDARPSGSMLLVS
jgi:hypothetical protein